MTITEDTKSGSVHLVLFKSHTNHEPGSLIQLDNKLNNDTMMVLVCTKLLMVRLLIAIFIVHF